LAQAHALAGRSAEAIELLEQITRKQTRRASFIGQRDSIALAEAYLRDGRLDEGLKTSRSVLELMRKCHARGLEGDVLRLLGDVHAARGEADHALSAYREALALAEPRGMRPLVAHCHFGLGKLYRGIEKSEQAREHLTTAVTMYREMDMRFYLEQAE